MRSFPPVIASEAKQSKKTIIPRVITNSHVIASEAKQSIKTPTESIPTLTCHAEFISASYQCGIKSWISFQINKILKQVQDDAKAIMSPAFSLVELLMALLVASLLMAALAPVMTRKVKDPDVKILAEAANYDKDSVITIFTDTSEQKEFNIPTDASRITLTAVGAGGAGGNALYGNKEFTTSQTFTVPQDVHKLRVFMVGAGGGGASGGMGNGTAYANTPAIGAVETTLTSAGTYALPDVVNIPNTYVAPALNFYCNKFGTLKKWVMKSDNSVQTNPGAKIAKVDGDAIVSLTKITACGGGGAGGYLGAAGGSGGYLANTSLSSSFPARQLSLVVAEGGGAYPNVKGGNGAGTAGAYSGYKTSQAANGIGQKPPGYGGGGGGGTALLASNNNILFEIGGGGGGGAYQRSWNNTHPEDTIANPWFPDNEGGGGGGKGAGGGGGRSTHVHRDDVRCYFASATPGNSDGTPGCYEGGLNAHYWRCGGQGYEGGGGGGGAMWADVTYGSSSCSGKLPYSQPVGSGGGRSGATIGPWDVRSSGGGGGGGRNGAGGDGCDQYTSFTPKGGTISTIFGENNCNGGNSGVDGKPGAMRVWYSIASVANGLQCTYHRQSNGGGGGGAGQVWMGEINVTPGQTITLNVGQGGNIQNIGAADGNDGNPTSIIVGGNTYSVSGGKGGKFENDNTYISNSGGLGGGLKKESIGNGSKYIDWLKFGENGIALTGGGNGYQGYLKTDSANGAGGNGGSILKIDGTYVDGGIGGTSTGNGTNGVNYGTGGGGGASGTDGTFGNGAAGAPGYIYIEWGGTNGGGGTNGEIVQKILTNFDMNDRKMLINIGKGGSNVSGNGNGGDTVVSVKSGGKNVIVTARGGIKGNIGTSDINTHGSEVKYPDNYSVLYKDFVQNNMSIVNGQKGINDYGGMGGYLACIYYSKDKEGNKVCNTSINSNDGVEETAGPTRPGCGGSAIPSPLYEAICNAKSTSASPDGGNGSFGGGGGGGAVLNRVGGKGGNGGNGFIILEYKSVQ